MKAVISQPMFFPWVGLFEQIRLADIYVHYDDVQLPTGTSFINRVQIKTKDGIMWLTVPLKRDNSKVLIKDALIADDTPWRAKHLKSLQNNYAKAKYRDEMLQIVDDVYKMEIQNLSALNSIAIESICRYFGIFEAKKFYTSSELQTTTSSSQKLVDTVLLVNADVYITGLGALNYIDYDLFEGNKIMLEYMEYKKMAYPQAFGEFTPYVSILDLIAYCGKEGKTFINSPSKYWKDYINESTRTV
jgi:WbqC-like protein family